MVKRKTILKVRRIHRYLGIFLGIQFLMWTISGMYFSWTNIDEIHGDHFRNPEPEQVTFTGLLNTPQLSIEEPVWAMELKDIGGVPYYWINHNSLYNARTGELKEGITAKEAEMVAGRYMLPELKVEQVTRITEVDAHHEYRGRPLPAYEIAYESPNDLKAYVAVENGAFQTVRHRNWRWFDFLWMTHTMDYQGRDNFNTLVLRAFSLLGLVTVLSGFLLWFVTSPSVMKLISRK